MMITENTLFFPSQKPELLAASFLQRLWWLSNSAQYKTFWVLTLSLPLLLYLQWQRPAKAFLVLVSRPGCACTTWPVRVAHLQGVSLSAICRMHGKYLLTAWQPCVDEWGFWQKRRHQVEKLHPLKCRGNSLTHFQAAYSAMLCYRRHQLALALSSDNMINIS